MQLFNRTKSVEAPIDPLNTPTKEIIRVCCSWPADRDYQRIADIESLCYVDPLTLSQIDQFRKRDCIHIGVARVLNSKFSSQVVGHYVFANEPGTDYFRLINLTVDPVYQGFGIGTQMLNHIKGKLSALKKCRIVEIAHEKNERAIKFFASQEFKGVGCEWDAFLNSDSTFSDGIVMEFWNF